MCCVPFSFCNFPKTWSLYDADNHSHDTEICWDTIKNGQYSKRDTQAQKCVNFVFFTREPGGGQVLITPDFGSVKIKFKKLNNNKKNPNKTKKNERKKKQPKTTTTIKKTKWNKKKKTQTKPLTLAPFLSGSSIFQKQKRKTALHHRYQGTCWHLKDSPEDTYCIYLKNKACFSPPPTITSGLITVLESDFTTFLYLILMKRQKKEAIYFRLQYGATPIKELQIDWHLSVFRCI